MGRETWNIFELRGMLGIVSNDLLNTTTRDLTGEEVVLSGFFSSIGIWPNHEVTPPDAAQGREVLECWKCRTWRIAYISEMSSGEVPDDDRAGAGA